MKFPSTWRGGRSSRRSAKIRSAQLVFATWNFAVSRLREISSFRLGAPGFLLRFWRRSLHRTRPKTLPAVLCLRIFSRPTLKIWIALSQAICTRLISRGRLALSPTSNRCPPHLFHLHLLLLPRVRSSLCVYTPFIPPPKANRISSEFTSGPPIEEGALALAKLVPGNDRAAPVNVDVAPHARRTALVALVAIPWSRNVVKRVGTSNLTVVISAAAAGLQLLGSSNHF